MVNTTACWSRTRGKGCDLEGCQAAASAPVAASPVWLVWLVYRRRQGRARAASQASSRVLCLWSLENLSRSQEEGLRIREEKGEDWEAQSREG